MTSPMHNSDFLATMPVSYIKLKLKYAVIMHGLARNDSRLPCCNHYLQMIGYCRKALLQRNALSSAHAGVK